MAINYFVCPFVYLFVLDRICISQFAQPRTPYVVQNDPPAVYKVLGTQSTALYLLAKHATN